MGGRTKLGRLGRGLMTLLTTCWSVCVWEMVKESGPANLWVSRAKPVGKQGRHHLPHELWNADEWEVRERTLFLSLNLPPRIHKCRCYIQSGVFSQKCDWVWYWLYVNIWQHSEQTSSSMCVKEHASSLCQSYTIVNHCHMLFFLWKLNSDKNEMQ